MQAGFTYFLLLGRQGVGKSSFVNMLTRRKKASCKASTVVTTKGLRPYRLFKKTYEENDIGICDTPGLSSGQFRPADFMNYIKQECDNRKIGGVIIMEEAGNLKMSSEMKFMLTA